MLDALIAEYLERGGTITKCPTVFLESSINARDLDNGMGSRETLEGLPLRSRARKARDIALSKAKGEASEKKRKEGPTSRELQARAERATREREAKQRELGKLLTKYNRGEPLADIAAHRGCSVKRIRELLRQAGVVFEKAPKAVKPKPEPKTANRFKSLPVHPRFAEMVASGMTSGQISKELGHAKRTIAKWRVALGLPPAKAGGKKKTGSKLTPESQAEIIRLYQSGVTSGKIAEQFVCCKSTVLEILKWHGVPTRPQGINVGKMLDDKLRRAIADDYARGDMRSSEIARKYGVGKATVVKSARKMGIPIRPSGPNDATRRSA